MICGLKPKFETGGQKPEWAASMKNYADWLRPLNYSGQEAGRSTTEEASRFRANPAPTMLRNLQKSCGALVSARTRGVFC
jgi:hypothetical protein